MERYNQTVTPLGHMCLSIDHIANLALKAGVITNDEFAVIYRAVWGISVARDVKELEATDAAS